MASLSTSALSGMAATGSGVRVASAFYAVVFTAKLRQQIEYRRLAGRYHLLGPDIPHAQYTDDPEAALPPSNPGSLPAGIYRLHTENFSRITLNGSELSIFQSVWKAISDRLGRVLQAKPTKFWRSPTARERLSHERLKAQHRLPSGLTSTAFRPYSTRSSLPTRPAGDHSTCLQWHDWPQEAVPGESPPPSHAELPPPSHAESSPPSHTELLSTIAPYPRDHSQPSSHRRDNSDSSLSMNESIHLLSRNSSPGRPCNDCSCSAACGCFARCSVQRAVLHPETPPRQSRPVSLTSTARVYYSPTILSEVERQASPPPESSARTRTGIDSRIQQEVIEAGAWHSLSY